MDATTAARLDHSARIHPATRVGHVGLTVADLDRVVAFYRDVLGFRIHGRAGRTVALGSGGSDLLRLAEGREAARVPGTTGLSHFAILIRRRVEFAGLYRRIAESGTSIQRMENQQTHEAIYLADPEGNSVELAWDFPREQRPSFEEVMRLGSTPLDAESLAAELGSGETPGVGLPDDATIGHVFLHVADLAAADAFYHGVLGFDVVGTIAGDAEFVSAGGYHHHVAFNLGAGAGAPPPPPGALGLDYFTIVVPDQTELDQILGRVRGAGCAVEARANDLLIRDPSRNGVLLTTEA